MAANRLAAKSNAIINNTTLPNDAFACAAAPVNHSAPTPMPSEKNAWFTILKNIGLVICSGRQPNTRVIASDIASPSKPVTM